MRASIFKKPIYLLFIFILFLTFSSNTHAEYYFATEGIDNCNTIVKTKIIYKYKRPHRHVHHRYHVRKRAYPRISVHYYLPPCNCCAAGYAPVCNGGCGTRFYRSCSSYFQVYPGSYGDPFMDSNYYYEYNRRIYFQDRATADDDAYFYPGMQINY